MNLETVGPNCQVSQALVASASLRIPQARDHCSSMYVKGFDIEGIDNDAVGRPLCSKLAAHPATPETQTKLESSNNVTSVDNCDDCVEFDLPDDARFGVIYRKDRGILRVEPHHLDGATEGPLAAVDIQKRQLEDCHLDIPQFQEESEPVKDFVDIPAAIPAAVPAAIPAAIPRIQIEKVPENDNPPAFHTELREPGPQRTANINAGSSVLHVSDQKCAGLNGAFGRHMNGHGLDKSVFQQMHKDILEDLDSSIEDVVLHKRFSSRKGCPTILEASAIAPLNQEMSGFCCLSILQNPKSRRPDVAPEYAMLYVVGPNGKRLGDRPVECFLAEVKLLGANMARLIEAHNASSDYPVEVIRVPLISGGIYSHTGIPKTELYKVALALLEGIAEHGSNVQWSFIDKGGVFTEAGEHLFKAGKYI
ncbi:MAG: hypothetical protein KVP17_000772 [Porospora cf. gigantea B]|uniref:uncharacterized protein n=2 Tax=Porospora cf. gigantea B TaxID=2853592 RepID=UPI0035719FBC|nr:MAG: hypothetical protein KVP17_000772 [Porospora cf. gigantea B]